MHIAFITVGDPRRLTGGYLYHARVFAALRAGGVALDELVASGAALAEQVSQAAAFAAFDPRPYDVVVVDALARAVCAPWLDRWRAARPVVAMIHELPSVAEAHADEATFEAPLLRCDLLIAVSAHGRAILEARGVPHDRIRVVSPGCDRIPTDDRGGEGERGRGGEGEQLKIEDRGWRMVDGRSVDREPSIEPEHVRAYCIRPHRTPKNRESVGQALPGRRLRILCVAQWIPRKGILALVRAWAARPRPGALLELIGETEADPGYAAQVRAAIARAPAEAPIMVRGAVDDAALAAAYRRAAIFALPSTYEGYGMAYAEALAHGLPVLACDVGPLPELVGAGGLLVPPDAPEALAGALDRLLGDAGLRARLARAALARAAALPTWDDTARGFQQVLEEAVSGRPP